jgi:mannosyltransferase OCH1-like enzyme|tara:strand:+ start:2543 stop:3265 length:723 start_codon:yes stop_codon:yes gene_type:complete
MNYFLLILILIIFIIFNYYNKNLFPYTKKINIIQTWKDNHIPLKYQPFVNQVKKMNPNANYMFFTDKDIEQFILTKFPQYYKTFKNFPYTIQKIDFFRYLAVYYYGGVYLDLDFKNYKSFDDIDRSKSVFPLEFMNSSDEILKQQGFKGLIGNYAFYAPKNHPFIKKIIDNIMSNRIKNVGNKYNNDKNKYVFYTTGPVLVTQSYIDFKQKEDIEIIKPTPFKKYNFGNYGVHYLMGSWK